MRKAYSKYFLLGVVVAFITGSCLFRCDVKIFKSHSVASSCHGADGASQEFGARVPNHDDNEKESSDCCTGAKTCCVVFADLSKPTFKFEASFMKAPFLEDWKQSQVYFSLWKPPKSFT